MDNEKTVEEIREERLVMSHLAAAMLGAMAVMSAAFIFMPHHQDNAATQQALNTRADMKKVIAGKAAQYTSSPYAGNLSCAAQVAQKALAYVETLEARFSSETLNDNLSGDTGTKTLAHFSEVMTEAGKLKALFDPSAVEVQNAVTYLEYKGAEVDVFGDQAYKIAQRTEILLSNVSMLQGAMNRAAGKDYFDGREAIDAMSNQATIVQNYSDFQGTPMPIKNCFGDGGALKF